MNNILEYITHFPEDGYPTIEDDYYLKVRSGLHIMQHSSINIVGLARDCASELKVNILRIEKLKKYFKESKVVIIENDSIDGTKEVLEKWKQVSNITVINCDCGAIRHPQEIYPERFHDMAYYRNLYLDHINYSYDYTLVYDFDIIGGFSYWGIANTIGWSGWNFMGSNSILYENDLPVYFDTLALRSLPGQNVSLDMLRGQPIISVQSAFGGLGIYKTPVLKGKKYLSGDCEHVTLHRQINDVYVNPSQIVLYSPTKYQKN